MCSKGVPWQVDFMCRLAVLVLSQVMKSRTMCTMSRVEMKDPRGSKSLQPHQLQMKCRFSRRRYWILLIPCSAGRVCRALEVVRRRATTNSWVPLHGEHKTWPSELLRHAFCQTCLWWPRFLRVRPSTDPRPVERSLCASSSPSVSTQPTCSWIIC